MSNPLRILYISAEVAPFAKAGGLGDVGGSLPKALRDLGHDVRVVMPAYGGIEAALHSGKYNLRPLPGHIDVPLRHGWLPAGVLAGQLPGSETPIYFIADRNLFDRPNLYGYGDDPYRFAFFSRASLALTQALNWQPDMLHAHDWHTAPAVTWLSTSGQGDSWFQGMPSLFTIHNLAHQGQTSWDLWDYLGLFTHRLVEEGYGEVNLMARGIYHATMINTVSPTYVREITSLTGGVGLDGLLRHRQYDLHGILNGLDYEEWNPATDGRLAAHFGIDNLDKRLENRRALQARAGLPQRDDIPLVAMVTRLDGQKGLDITGHVIHLLLNGYAGDAQFVVLGTGAAQYEDMFRQMAHYHPEKMTAFLAYDANLAPLIYGGSDIFLMPSLFEPCGLGQLIAMRYGCVPVVRATGGLADTVQDGITGFSFYDYTAGAFWDALQRAIYVYNVDKESWQRIQENGMKADFSWERSAHGYVQLYRWALARVGR